MVYLLHRGSALGSINERTKEAKVYCESSFLGHIPNAVDVAHYNAGNVWVSHGGMDTLRLFKFTTLEFTEVATASTIAAMSVSIQLSGGSGIFSKPVGDILFSHGGVGKAAWFTQL